MKPITIKVSGLQARELVSQSPADAFAFAEKICAAAYAEQGGPSNDSDERYEQQQARKKRDASWFEELYCRVRDMADDWHREATRRYLGIEKGKYDHDYLDGYKAIEHTGRRVFERVSDWDY